MEVPIDKGLTVQLFPGRLVMKKLCLLLVCVVLGTAACSDASSPTTASAAKPALNETPCKNGGYVGSDGRWVCY